MKTSVILPFPSGFVQSMKNPLTGSMMLALSIFLNLRNIMHRVDVPVFEIFASTKLLTRLLDFMQTEVSLLALLVNVRITELFCLDTESGKLSDPLFSDA